LQRLILRAGVSYLLLARSLLRVEPEATPGEHRWDYEQLNSGPDRAVNEELVDDEHDG
jgi:hypothetical protein